MYDKIHHKKKKKKKSKTGYLKKIKSKYKDFWKMKKKRLPKAKETLWKYAPVINLINIQENTNLKYNTNVMWNPGTYTRMLYWESQTIGKDIK